MKDTYTFTTRSEALAFEYGFQLGRQRGCIMALSEAPHTGIHVMCSGRLAVNKYFQARQNFGDNVTSRGK